jgi:hypothetical protein
MANYNPNGLNLVTSLTPQIQTASEYYGVSPFAIAGAIAQEQLNQSEHWERAALSMLDATGYIGTRYATGLAVGLVSDPLHANTVARKVASDLILSQYNATDNLVTTGRDLWKKAQNSLLVDYGPAGVKFANALSNVISNPDAPGLAPYVNNYWTLGAAILN